MMTTAGSAKIVCATDFSASAAAALRWAVTTAAAPGDSIDLVTVLAPPATSFVELMMDAGVVESGRMRVATERLAEMAGIVEREHGVAITPYVLTGQPPRAIAAHAETANARLVVMGARSRSILDRAVLGSVAERTVRVCNLPVAVVPPTDEPGPAAAGRSGHPLRVLVGLEGGTAGDRALDLAGDLHQPEPATSPFCISTGRSPSTSAWACKGRGILFTADPADVVRNLEPKLRNRIRDLPGQGSVELSIPTRLGSPAANLLAVANEGDYQLLIVRPQRRHGYPRFWHPSVSQR